MKKLEDLIPDIILAIPEYEQRNNVIVKSLIPQYERLSSCKPEFLATVNIYTKRVRKKSK